MVRFFVATAANCVAGAASAAAFIPDETFADTSFTSGQLPTGGPEQSYYPASRESLWSEYYGAPLRLNDYPALNMRPSGDVYGEYYRDIRGLSFGQGLGGVVTPLPAEIAPVPEAHEWAMIVAGLGVVGFAAKRRKAAA